MPLCVFPAFAKGGRAEVKEHLRQHYHLYGFVRDYLSLDTRESKSGTVDEFYYLPKDRLWNEDHTEDLNERLSLRYVALTTRLGVDVDSYQVSRTRFGGRVEGDFFCLNGTSAAFRMRHAYATIEWDSLAMGREGKTARVQLLLGQGWHPISVGNLSDISPNYGAPFNAHNRSPQITMRAEMDGKYEITASLIWQMQYLSTGPEGPSMNYMKYSCTPEAYVGFSVKNKGWHFHAGADVLSIKPRVTGTNANGVTVRVSDRLTTVNPCVFLEYRNRDLQVAVKSVPYSSAGEHLYLMSGYATTRTYADGHSDYTPIHCASSWLSVLYGRKWQCGLMLGYTENLGSGRAVESPEQVYFNSNGYVNLNRLCRVVPSVCYNAGHFTVGVQYQYTAALYGDTEGAFDTASARYLEGEHWVSNHRTEAMFKYRF